MKIDILTLFPQMFDNFLDTSIIKKSIDKGLVSINPINLRDYSTDKHKKVDDTIYGGNPGMLIFFPLTHKAITTLNNEYVVYLTPQGKILNQETSIRLSKKESLTILCGHYEGFDSRIDDYVDEEISIGDYVLTGGELPACVLLDSVIRCIDGVIDSNSLTTDSLYNGLLKQPEYTKPREYLGAKVPEILVNGDHELMRIYNLRESLRTTLKKRPDLLEKKELTQEEKNLLQQIIDSEKI
jgi:tRNA (guanine37-N1)-methyltransferase